MHSFAVKTVRTTIFLACVVAAAGCGKKETAMEQAMNAMPPACKTYLEKTQACVKKMSGNEAMAAMEKQMEEQAKQMTEQLKKASKEELEKMAQACTQVEQQLTPMFSQMGC
ncbi:hypothetical protein E9531_12555 [Lampropedia puyangensis]|uniref:Lipoprotein n=1 Tax=Lampropedia puyangensis TaxID=1330072 RepID=A0A4S8EXY4_9BURK|nr:hypothetical protein [Lampropedia puyangensis]THT99398.1 hypothetical protein E9531_12555 [Lampropedia puyangensis]